jgi:PIN domain nuclease of toxin-antitoxin system
VARALIDTHVFLWAATDRAKLSPTALAFIDDTGNELLFSVASAWELFIKHSTGRLTLDEEPAVLIPRQVRDLILTVLPVEMRHLEPLTAMPHHHRDPFDRLLIAQSIVEGVPLLSADTAFAPYTADGLSLLW